MTTRAKEIEREKHVLAARNEQVMGRQTIGPS
jgi:hypothetical protein